MSADNVELPAAMRQRLKVVGDLMTMMQVLPTDRLVQLATSIAPEVQARLKELSRPRVVAVDGTRVRP